MDENLGKLKPIKVNQGEKFLNNEGEQDEMAGCPVRGGDGPSPLRGTPDASVDCSPSWRGSQPQSACGAGSVPDGPFCRCATDSTSYGLHSDPIQLQSEGDKSVSIKVDQGEIFYDQNIEDEDEEDLHSPRDGTTPWPRSLFLHSMGERKSGAGESEGSVRLRPATSQL
jgi:hypothetical protein